jgi:hypothetical protein
VRGAFPAAISAKFFRKVNFLVRPVPELCDVARTQWRCALRCDSVESSCIAETSILSALPRYRRFSAANFCQAKSLCWSIGAAKSPRTGGAERRGRYTQN